MQDRTRTLKFHTEALVKAIGVEASSVLTGRSKATLGRYYSDREEHMDRFMPVDAVALLEAAAGFPHVTAALAEIAGYDVVRRPQVAAEPRPDARHTLNEDVAALSTRFATLLRTYADAMADDTVSPAELRRILTETVALQRVLVDMKLHLERC